MPINDAKTRENRLRRAAHRQQLQLVKSRSRHPQAPDYGGYMLVDLYTNTIVAGELHSPLALSLDEVEANLLA